tara:strand:+ start:275 stop:418 length:144 start_codon:yes stop_codon:yes gene_type:complete
MADDNEYKTKKKKKNIKINIIILLVLFFSIYIVLKDPVLKIYKSIVS